MQPLAESSPSYSYESDNRTKFLRDSVQIKKKYGDILKTIYVIEFRRFDPSFSFCFYAFDSIEMMESTNQNDGKSASRSPYFRCTFVISDIDKQCFEPFTSSIFDKVEIKNYKIFDLQHEVH